jgi:hypothetical protein
VARAKNAAVPKSGHIRGVGSADFARRADKRRTAATKARMKRAAIALCVLCASLVATTEARKGEKGKTPILGVRCRFCPSPLATV